MRRGSGLNRLLISAGVYEKRYREARLTGLKDSAADLGYQLVLKPAIPWAAFGGQDKGVSG